MCRCSAHAELENSRRTYSAQENLLMRKKQEILLRCGVLEVRMRNWNRRKNIMCKKITAVLLSIVLGAALLTGCGAKGAYPSDDIEVLR